MYIIYWKIQYNTIQYLAGISIVAVASAEHAFRDLSRIIDNIAFIIADNWHLHPLQDIRTAEAT